MTTGVFSSIEVVTEKMSNQWSGVAAWVAAVAACTAAFRSRKRRRKSIAGVKRIAILNLPGGYDYVPFFLNWFRRNGVHVVGQDPPSKAGAQTTPVYFKAFNFDRGEKPTSISDFDGYVVTGSTCGVYESDPWIKELGDYIVRIHEKNIPMVGICFGHQIIAHVLGGYAAKNPSGWELGATSFNITEAATQKLQQLLGTQQAQSIPSSLPLQMVHGDAVLRLPEGFTSLGGTHNTSIEGMISNDLRVLTLQGHPEFTNECVSEIVSKFESSIDTNVDHIGTHSNGLVSMLTQGYTKADVEAQAQVNVTESSDAVAKWCLALFGIH